MKLSVPKGESPVGGGVVTLSQASGKVANCEVSTEVSQTAVSVLTPYRVRGRLLNRNYIQRLLGRMRYHMLPKSKSSKEGCTEMVDVAGISTRIPAGRRRVHLTEGGLELYESQIEKSAEVIVVNKMNRYRKDKVGVLTGLMKD